jgi:hypothetical protein
VAALREKPNGTKQKLARKGAKPQRKRIVLGCFAQWRLCVKYNLVQTKNEHAKARSLNGSVSFWGALRRGGLA